MSELHFQDRVVLITGAGGGLGRSYAAEFALRGAKVIVNDMSAAASNAVVDSILAAGGSAAATTDSVEDGDKLIAFALERFGRLDVLINNAGILRDRTFAKMTEEEWEAVYRVHLLGAFRVTRAAWPHMIQKGYGRVVMTTSASGIYGNFGQANYAAAKSGTIGLAQTLAAEGLSKGIRVNTIAPVAASPLSANAFPAHALPLLKSDYVTPLVVLLAHESCPVSGQLFEVGGGWVSQTRWQQSPGAHFKGAFTAEDLSQAWDQVTSFEGATNIANGGESVKRLMARSAKH